MMELSGFVSPV